MLAAGHLNGPGIEYFSGPLKARNVVFPEQEIDPAGQLGHRLVLFRQHRFQIEAEALESNPESFEVVFCLVIFFRGVQQSL